MIMEFEEGLTIEIQLNVVQSLGIAVLCLCLGHGLIRHSPLLARTTIPAAIIGGFIFALANAIGFISQTVHFISDSQLASFFMVFYFVTIGFNASLKALSQSRSTVFKFFFWTVVVIFAQNILAILIGRLLDFPPLLALLVGSPSLVGGPGTAAAVAPSIQALGYDQALTVGLTAATIGIVVGSMFAAPLGNRLIQNHQLYDPDQSSPTAQAPASVSDQGESGTTLTCQGVYQATLLIFIAMFIGSFITTAINLFVGRFIQGISFPIVLGPMLVAFIMRNISDRLDRPFVESAGLDTLSTLSLDIFLALTIIGLELWQIFYIALPMLIIISILSLLTLAFAYFILFRLMNGTYDAAILSAGFMGFAMGTSSNAMAAMQSLTDRYEPSPLAVLTVSIVAGLFVDFTNVLIIYTFIGFLA